MADFAAPPTNQISTQPSRIWSDLDISFAIVPVTGDVAVNTGDAAVIASVENLVLTAYYERPFSPLLGSSVSQLLFDNMTPMTATLISTSISEVLSNYEPRVSVQSINVDAQPENNAFIATITFYILNNVSPTTITLFLERLR